MVNTMKGKNMKKLIALMLAFGVTAGIADAQTQVLSQNAVGYVKIEAGQGNLYLLRNDFESVDGEPMSIANVLDDQVPAGSQVILYDEAGQQYLPSIGRTAFGWAPAASNVLARGASFFLRIPDNSPELSYDLFIMGEVPDDDTPLSFVPGLNMAGVPFPASMEWLDTEIAEELPPGSQLILWDPVGQSYVPSIGKTAFGWAGAATGLVIEPGQGFFIRLPDTAGVLSFDELKPYTWP